MNAFMSPLQPYSTFCSLSWTIQLGYNICQLINYNSIKNIRSKPIFGKSSIYDQSCLSNKMEQLTRYQLQLY